MQSYRMEKKAKATGKGGNKWAPDAGLGTPVYVGSRRWGR